MFRALKTLMIGSPHLYCFKQKRTLQNLIQNSFSHQHVCLLFHAVMSLQKRLIYGEKALQDHILHKIQDAYGFRWPRNTEKGPKRGI